MIAPARVLPVVGALTVFAMAWSCASHKPAPAPVPSRSPVGNPARPSLGPVPDELMTVLGRGATALPGDAVELSAGPAPDDFPKDLLPPGTDVGAAAVSARMTTVVGIASGVATSDRRKEESRLTAAGWISQGPTRRGFVVGTFDGLISVCRGTDFVSIRYVDRPTGGSVVRAALTKDPRRGCVPRPDMGFPRP